jgi:hypothetical protein
MEDGVFQDDDCDGPGQQQEQLGEEFRQDRSLPDQQHFEPMFFFPDDHAAKGRNNLLVRQNSGGTGRLCQYYLIINSGFPTGGQTGCVEVFPYVRHPSNSLYCHASTI